MSRGSIRRRGKRSWQIRFDDGIDAAGRRKARWATVKGTRQHAQRELTRLLVAADAGRSPSCELIGASNWSSACPWVSGSQSLTRWYLVIRMDRPCRRTTFREIGGGHAGHSACRW